MKNTALSGLAILLIFLLVFLASGAFEYGAQQPRPVLLFVGLLMLATVCALVGLRHARLVQEHQHKKLLLIIFALALSIRLVAIFTTPILEIDYYRYIWDGKVVCEGVSPYRFSPVQALESGVSRNEDLNRIGELSTRSQSNHVVLSRIHYGTYTTLYPPVSQAVFAAAMQLTPETLGVEAHVIVMKIAMTLFDLGVIVLVGGLLGLARKHPCWLIAYAWNPLVIKEITNSGHLDSIATFFAVLTLYLMVRRKTFPGAKLSKWLLPLTGITLGLGVGAKLYPVVLFPALLVSILKSPNSLGESHLGKSLISGAVFSVAFVITSFLVLLPMFQKHSGDCIAQPVGSNVSSNVATEAMKNQDGFGGFFSRWRMNDPIFSTVYFNLKSDTKDSMQPWFVLTSQHWRSKLNDQIRSLGFDGKDPTYLMTRILTMSLFSCFYLWHLRGILLVEHGDRQWSANLISRITSILALFLFLQPTVNPWYFVWVAPFVCLTNNRGWLLASGILMLYYSRFWFKSLAGTFVLGGHSFSGAKLFDHGFVFVEFGLIVAVLVYFSNREKPAISE